MMKSNLLGSIRSSVVRKQAIAFISIWMMLFQNGVYAGNSVLSSSTIQKDINSNPLFEYTQNNSDFQYIVDALVERYAPKAEDLSSFVDAIKTTHREALNGITYVPIINDGITVILPLTERPKFVGTPLVQSRYIRYQIRQLLGKQLIDADSPKYANEVAQLNTLYAGAFQYLNDNPGAKLGETLDFDQDASPLDMVWPEYREINNETVLVPIVYLSSGTVSSNKVIHHVATYNGQIEIGNLNIDGVTVSFGRDAFLKVLGDVNNNSGTILASESLRGVIGGTLNNISGAIEADKDIDLMVGRINSQTLVHRYDFYGRSGEHFGEVAEILAGGNVELKSYSDILIQGGVINADQGALTIAANGNITVAGREIINHSGSRHGNNFNETTQTAILPSFLSANEALKLSAANGGINISASTLHSDKGQIELLANLGVIIEDKLETYQNRGHRKWGKTTADWSAYKTVAIRSALDAGKGVRIHTNSGDITLKAVDIKSTEGTSVVADSGGINMLMTVEDDQYNYDSVKKSFLTIKTESRGHDIETAVNTTIVGGFIHHATEGLRVEYQGDPDLSFDEQITNLSRLEGLSWMADVKTNMEKEGLDVDWNKVELAYKKWDKSKTSLSPAAIAIITIIAAVVTAGAAAGVGSLLTTGATTATTLGPIGTAVAAGASTFMTQGIVAVSQGFVSGDMEEALDDFMSEETAKAMATSMLTAGAIAALDANFFQNTPSDAEVVQLAEANNVAGLTRSSADWAKWADEAKKLSLGQQAIQAVTHASTSSLVNWAIEGGDFEALRDGFVKSVGNSAVNAIGKKMANEIGEARRDGDISKAVQYIAHAGSGCILGAAKAGVSRSSDTEGACVAGAGGAVIGELVADVSRSQTQAGKDSKKIEDYLKSKGLKDISGLSDDELANLRSKLDIGITAQEMTNWENGTIDLAKLSGALTAFVAGASAEEINIANFTAENAAKNNGFWFIPIGIILLKAADVALTAKEYHELSQKLDAAGSDENKKLEILKEHFGIKGEEIAVGAVTAASLKVLAKKLGPGVTTFDAIVDFLKERKVFSGKYVEKLKGWFKKNGNTSIPENAILGSGLNLSKVNVLTLKDAKRLGGPNRGLIFVQEKTSKSIRAGNFEDGTTGAFSDVLSQRKASPALRFNHPEPNGNLTNNFVRFDGVEADGVTLIDRKLNLTSRSDQVKSLHRVSEALKQNTGFNLVYEFPDQKAANRASKILFKEKIMISVRVATP